MALRYLRARPKIAINQNKIAVLAMLASQGDPTHISASSQRNYSSEPSIYHHVIPNGAYSKNKIFSINGDMIDDTTIKCPSPELFLKEECAKAYKKNKRISHSYDFFMEDQFFMQEDRYLTLGTRTGVFKPMSCKKKSNKSLLEIDKKQNKGNLEARNKRRKKISPQGTMENKTASLSLSTEASDFLQDEDMENKQGYNGERRNSSDGNELLLEVIVENEGFYETIRINKDEGDLEALLEKACTRNDITGRMALQFQINILQIMRDMYPQDERLSCILDKLLENNYKLIMEECRYFEESKTDSFTVSSDVNHGIGLSLHSC